jgi:hypothetical protein
MNEVLVGGSSFAEQVLLAETIGGSCQSRLRITNAKRTDDKGLAFSRDTERQFSDSSVVLAGRNSGQLTTVQVHA